MDTHNQTTRSSHGPSTGGLAGTGAADASAVGSGFGDLHLTDEQFTDLLLGTIPPAVTTHLEGCARCAEEAQRVSGAIGSFSFQSQMWAERRAAAGPELSPYRQPLLSWLDRPAAWTAAAATLVLAVVVGAGAGVAHWSKPNPAMQQASASEAEEAGPKEQVAAAQVAAGQIAAGPSEMRTADPPVRTDRLKADNDLLSAIDGELSADGAPPASMYGLSVGTQGTRSKSTKRISN
jgi:hypothetical protein